MNSSSTSTSSVASVRVDRWLWAARFFKTRSLAKAAIEGGKVHLQGKRIKPAREVAVGDELVIRRGDTQQTIIVADLSEQRGPAKVAQLLYRETDQSIEQRAAEKAERAMQRAGLRVPERRPSKKDRRELRKLKTLETPGE